MKEELTEEQQKEIIMKLIMKERPPEKSMDERFGEMTAEQRKVFVGALKAKPTAFYVLWGHIIVFVALSVIGFYSIGIFAPILAVLISIYVLALFLSMQKEVEHYSAKSMYCDLILRRTYPTYNTNTDPKEFHRLYFNRNKSYEKLLENASL